MGADVTVLPSVDRVLSDSMLTQLEIAVREIEEKLSCVELEYKTYGMDKDKAFQVVQDINASVNAQKHSVINNIMINNIEMKSITFIFEIKKTLDLLKQKIRFCRLLEDKAQ